MDLSGEDSTSTLLVDLCTSVLLIVFRTSIQQLFFLEEFATCSMSGARSFKPLGVFTLTFARHRRQLCGNRVGRTFLEP